MLVIAIVIYIIVFFIGGPLWWGVVKKNIKTYS